MKRKNECNKRDDSSSNTSDIKRESNEDEFAADVNIGIENEDETILTSELIIKEDHDKHNETGSSEEKAFECYHCKTRFKKKAYLKRHIYLHTGEKPFKCDICQRGFHFKYGLLQHRSVTHSKEKRFECGVCKKPFKWKVGLRNHVLSKHSKEELFKCDVCYKQFTRKEILHRHMSTHSEEKAFECHLCKRRYKIKANLRRHVYVHSREEEIKRDAYERKFHYKSCSTLMHSEEKLSKCDVFHKLLFVQKDHLQQLQLYTEIAMKIEDECSGNDCSGSNILCIKSESNEDKLAADANITSESEGTSKQNRPISVEKNISHSNDNITNLLTQAVNTILTTVNQRFAEVNARLDVMEEYIKRTSLENATITSPATNIFPLKTNEDILNLEESLKCEEFKQQLMAHLRKINGVGYSWKKASYKLCDYMFNRELLTNYTWTGATRKQHEIRQPFNQLLYILQLFYETVRYSDVTHSLVNNEKFFKQLLKHSRERTVLKE